MKYKNKLTRTEAEILVQSIELFSEKKSASYAEALLQFTLCEISETIQERLQAIEKQKISVAWKKGQVYAVIIYTNYLISRFEISEHWIIVLHNLRNSLLQKFSI